VSGDVTRRINLVITTTGAENSRKAVESLEGTLRNLYKQGTITDKELANGARSMEQLGQASAKTTDATNKATEATKKAASATDSFANSAPRLRYALYDVATTANLAGAALLGLSTASTATAISMDRRFADVARTTGVYMDKTGKEANDLRDDFEDLFTSIPQSWNDLTRIGTLAGQLGIAKQNVAEFTKLVAEFATVTDVSVDTAATAFGRLSQLLDVPATKYENLGSAIVATGVSSVATESQIINISSQIASLGSFAGFTADQVIGLSSAMASLGVQPELARGVITRLFTNISTAVSDGSDRLKLFGKVSGLTSQEFATAWGDDAAGALEQFLTGLGGVEDSKAISVLQELGITASRDIPTILKLAQNSEVLTDQMRIASQGFQDGTALADQYGVVAETVASKITVLKNNLQNLLGTIGESSTGPIAAIVDLLTRMAKAATDFLSTGFGQVLALVAVGATAVAGALGLILGAMALGVASTLALRTALDGLAVSGNIARFNMATLRGEIETLTGSAVAARIAIGTIKTALISTGIGAAVVAIGTAISLLTQRSSEAKHQFDEFGASLREAITQDTQNGDASIRRLKVTIEDTGDAAVDSANQAYDMANALAGVGDGSVTARDGVDDLNTSLDELYINLGAVTDQAIRKGLVDAILGDDPAKAASNLATWNDVLSKTGLTMNDIVQGIESGNVPAALSNFAQTLLDETANVDATGNSLANFTQGSLDANYATLDLLDSVGLFNNTTQDTIALAQTQANAYKAAGVEMEQSAASANEYGDSLNDLTDGMFDLLNAQYALIGSTYDLGASLATNGLDFSEQTAAGRENLGALTSTLEAVGKVAGDDADLFSAYVHEIINQLVGAGVTGAAQLAPIRAALAGLANPSATAQMIAQSQLTGQIATGMSSVADNTGRAASNARKAAKEIRTLADYVSDLSSVMKDAFEYRFGLQEAADDATSKFQDLAQSLSDARDKLADLRLEIQQLQADIMGQQSSIAILEYQLTVAREYGDTLREQEIVAELADKNADLAKSQSDLAKKQKDATKAQQAATPTLTGNTEAAIDQRNSVLELLGSYEDLIVAYAAAGHSQQEVARYAESLRQKFQAQLTSLGYTNAEIKKYTAAFGDFQSIISKVPRNLTVKADADTSPAQKALDQFFAKNKNRSVTTTQNIKTNYQAPSNTKYQRAAEYTSQINALIASLVAGKYNPNLVKYVQPQIDALMKKRKALVGYATGGFTGRGGKYEPAGEVHRGEYVIPARDVNQSTGLPYADALNRLSRGTTAPAPSYAGGGFVSGPGYTELGPNTLRNLAKMMVVELNLDGRQIATSVNNYNRNVSTVGRS